MGEQAGSAVGSPAGGGVPGIGGGRGGPGPGGPGPFRF